MRPVRGREQAENGKRALAIDEKVLGPEHPNVAIRLNNCCRSEL
jgi:hypothetical protein